MRIPRIKRKYYFETLRQNFGNHSANNSKEIELFSTLNAELPAN